jgi:hypothetical protein
MKVVVQIECSRTPLGVELTSQINLLTPRLNLWRDICLRLKRIVGTYGLFFLNVHAYLNLLF